MKRIHFIIHCTLIAIILPFVSSCKDDDEELSPKQENNGENSNGQNDKNNSNTTAKENRIVKCTSYDASGSITSYYTNTWKDDYLANQTIYISGTPSSKQESTKSGNTVTTKSYNYSNGSWEYNGQSVIEYDNQNRIIKNTSTYASIATTSYYTNTWKDDYLANQTYYISGTPSSKQESTKSGNTVTTKSYNYSNGSWEYNGQSVVEYDNQNRIIKNTSTYASIEGTTYYTNTWKEDYIANSVTYVLGTPSSKQESTKSGNIVTTNSYIYKNGSWEYNGKSVVEYEN